jgi:putative nucleotidyltransferase with HDIG domain
MPIPFNHMHTCPNCGREIEENRYVMRPDGTFRCEHCYFSRTYLDGVVGRIDTAYLVTLEALVSAIDAREHEVGNHSLRVTEFSLIIGKTCGVTGRNLVDLYCGALLHDIGKIGVPDAVLHKRGPLSPEEQAVMQKHPETGYHIINHIGYFARAAEIIRTHHEHYDGTGYPRGLKGEDIPHGARIFAMADTLDALTVRRPYREPLSFEGALETILKESGTIFDPGIIGTLLGSVDELRDYVGRIVIDNPEQRDIGLT